MVVMVAGMDTHMVLGMVLVMTMAMAMVVGMLLHNLNEAVVVVLEVADMLLIKFQGI